MSLSRIVTLFDEINPKSSREIVQGLLELESEGSNMPIIFLINSPGGDVYSMLGIIDVMSSLSCPIITVCTGAAFSGAAVILMAGKLRFATKHSRIMLHEPMTSNGRDSKLQDLQNDTVEMAKLMGIMIDLIALYTKHEKEKIKQDLKKDFYLSPQEAKDYGIIDHIGFISSSSLISSISIELPEEVKKPKSKAKSKGRKDE
jgi:ATP-dependent Clp protease protease subunit